MMKLGNSLFFIEDKNQSHQIFYIDPSRSRELTQYEIHDAVPTSIKTKWVKLLRQHQTQLPGVFAG